jgi:hypothetical protein
MSDTVLTVRQIAQYPPAQAVAPADVLLLQHGGLGGPYASVTAPTLLATALSLGGSINLAPGSAIAWNGAALTWTGTDGFTFSDSIAAASVFTDAAFVGGVPVATQADIAALGAAVTSFNGRTGAVQLETDDILRAGGAPTTDAHFAGYCTAPTAWDFRTSSDQLATTAFVQMVIGQLVCGGSVVTSFDGRGGDVTLTTADVNAAYATLDGTVPTAPNPALGDASGRVATTLFVDESVEDLRSWTASYFATLVNLSAYAPLNSPVFTGTPSAPTPAPGSNTGQLATTAFVAAAVSASTSGVASFNTRTGTVTLTAADVTAAGGALLAGPTFTGTPAAPTAAPGTGTTQLATTAFVAAAITSMTAGVASFNTRTGAVTLTAADVTGAGGAPLASPTFTGTPAAPTASPGSTSTTQLATTAFVQSAIAAGAVASFNGRAGAVTLNSSDISAAAGALLAGPSFTGAPTAPTATAGTSTAQLATTQFVAQAIAAAGGVATFNGRAGAVTLSLADVIAAGGAPAAQNRNRLINGHFIIDQRYSFAAVTPAAGAYICDRWDIGISQPSKIQVQAQSNINFQPGAAGQLNLSTVSAFTAAAADYFQIGQSVEFQNISDFNFGYSNASAITLSFLVTASVAGTYSGSLTNTGSARSYVFTFTLAASTWTRVVLTIPGDVAGTWYPGSANGLGLQLRFDLGSGSSFRTATAGSWIAGNFIGAAGSVAMVANAGAIMAFSNVQLELGTAATTFDWRSVADTLAQCRRYFQDVWFSLFAPVGGIPALGGAVQTVTYPVAMRAPPAVSATDNIASGAWTGATTPSYTLAADNIRINPAVTQATAGAYLIGRARLSAEL